MRVLAVLGSPRKKGNTAALLEHFLHGVRSSGDHSVGEVLLQDLKISPCRNCDSCRRLDGRYCAIDDDMQQLFQPFIEAEMLVLASPIYWWSISGQLKLFVDRLYGLNFEKNPHVFKNKKLVLIFTHYEELPCSGAQIALRMFREIAGYTGMRIVGVLQYCSGERHVRECAEKLQEAEALGRRLGCEQI